MVRSSKPSGIRACSSNKPKSQSRKNNKHQHEKVSNDQKEDEHTLQTSTSFSIPQNASSASLSAVAKLTTDDNTQRHTGTLKKKKNLKTNHTVKKKNINKPQKQLKLNHLNKRQKQRNSIFYRHAKISRIFDNKIHLQ